ncbi:endolytic transglycosylase MltG [Candidatus Falkowbacteria bacterium]|nr:MAG: endolytic transglycosylase MltG [Candidatus Falkowbacteria bacterium]
MFKRVLLLFLIIIGTVVLAYIVWYQTVLGHRSRNTNNEVVSIASGTSTSDILENLKSRKLIDSTLAVKIYLFRHKDLKILAGEYEFTPNTSTRQLIAHLTTGKSLSNEVSILFREGLTNKEMQVELTRNRYLIDNSFLELAQTQVKDLPESIKKIPIVKDLPQNADLEGYLFPDTYRLYKDFTAEDLVVKMLTNFDAKLNPDLRAEIIKSKRSLKEIITMASLLEKEVRTEKDMKIVSGIFWDRIEVGQALQSCASLAYILGVNKVQYSYEDTQIKSPYNTYQNPGLTPSPIGNPGLRAIQAALYPTETNYNYFLSRPDTGETVFSETLEQHNEAKAKYLK